MVSIRSLALVAPLLSLTNAIPFPSAAPAPDVFAKDAATFAEINDAVTFAGIDAALQRATGGVVTGPAAVVNINDQDGIGAGTDSYTMYKGDGSPGSGWPTKNKWISFGDMWNKNKNEVLKKSCSWNGWPPENTEAEIGGIYDAIQKVAAETKVDHRFILAIIIQESKGCVRAPTTPNVDPSIWNPGLMQCHSGAANCVGKNPCPKDTILAMVREGTSGTPKGDGLAQVLNKAQTDFPNSGARAFYAAAKYYNGGSIPPSKNLEDGCCTRCYASDIANRLTGWTTSPTSCTL